MAAPRPLVADVVNALSYLAPQTYDPNATHATKMAGVPLSTWCLLCYVSFDSHRLLWNCVKITMGLEIGEKKR